MTQQDVPRLPPDFAHQTAAMINRVAPFTMTSPERLFALRQAVQYVVRNKIAGDIVECGVWRGGSMMAVALTLLELGALERKLWLFDTFEGMPPPTEADVDLAGTPASKILQMTDKQTSIYWGYGPLEQVQWVMRQSGYDPSKIVMVKGKVEETVPANAPDQIALLRLDTDWYESTYHEMVHLYPRLAVGGILIVDDYGHWQGARRAVDQYLQEKNLRLLLNRVDYTARVAVKLDP
jgi:O-methyltransferase